MPRRVLITGVSGFTGRHLAEALHGDPGCLVLGTGRRPVAAAPLAGYRPCDLTHEEDVRRLVEWAEPEVVYHLAARQGDAPAGQLEQVNIGGFRTLRDALRRFANRRTVRLLVIGSAAEIGAVPPERLPIDETIDCRPLTAYGASKHALVREALTEPVSEGVEISVARPFNLLGAGLDRQLAPAAFAQAVRAVARGETDTIRCGWLGGRRDYLDVADAVRAYIMLTERASPGTLVHVCSGASITMSELLARLLEHAGVEARVVATSAPAAHDVADSRGSHAGLTALTGWQPTVPLADSLADLYDALDGP